MGTTVATGRHVRRQVGLIEGLFARKGEKYYSEMVDLFGDMIRSFHLHLYKHRSASTHFYPLITRLPAYRERPIVRSLFVLRTSFFSPIVASIIMAGTEMPWAGEG